MTKKEVLKHLDELVKPLQIKPQWTTDEAIAMQVQTFRTYRLVARNTAYMKHGKKNVRKSYQ